MTESELVEASRIRLAGPEARIDRWSFPEPLPREPATAAALDGAEAELGVSIPRLLRSVFQNVANGGFGPGHGIFGVEGGHPGRGGMTIGPLYAFFRTNKWPAGFIPLCDWGGGAWSAVDARQPEATVVTLDESGVTQTRFSLGGWLEAWLAGANLFDETFEVVEVEGPGLTHPVTKERVPFQKRRPKGVPLGWNP